MKKFNTLCEEILNDRGLPFKKYYYGKELKGGDMRFLRTDKSDLESFFEIKKQHPSACMLKLDVDYILSSNIKNIWTYVAEAAKKWPTLSAHKIHRIKDIYEGGKKNLKLSEWGLTEARDIENFIHRYIAWNTTSFGDLDVFYPAGNIDTFTNNTNTEYNIYQPNCRFERFTILEDLDDADDIDGTESFLASL